MSTFQDISIIAASFNLLSMVGNLLWTWRLNGVKGNSELISYWKEKCEQSEDKLKDMDERLQEMVKRKNEMKIQYQHQLTVNKQLEGEIKTYKEFHKHAQF